MEKRGCRAVAFRRQRLDHRLAVPHAVHRADGLHRGRLHRPGTVHRRPFQPTQLVPAVVWRVSLPQQLPAVVARGGGRGCLGGAHFDGLGVSRGGGHGVRSGTGGAVLGGPPAGRGPGRGIHGSTAVFPAVALLLGGARDPRGHRRMVRPAAPRQPGALRGRTAPGFAALPGAGRRSAARGAREAASVALPGSRPGAGRRGAEQLDRRLRAGARRRLLPAGRVGRGARPPLVSALAACRRHRMLRLCPGGVLGPAIHHPDYPHQRAQAGGLGIHGCGRSALGVADRGRSAAGLVSPARGRRAARALRPHVSVEHGGGDAGRPLAAHQVDSPARAVSPGNGPGLLAHRHAGRRTPGGAFPCILVAGGAPVRLGSHRSGLPAAHFLPAPPRPRSGAAHRHFENGRVSHLALAGRQPARSARVRPRQHRFLDERLQRHAHDRRRFRKRSGQSTALGGQLPDLRRRQTGDRGGLAEGHGLRRHRGG